MTALLEIYRRFFHMYRGRLLVAAAVLTIVSLEPYAWGAFTQYLVDDVLQIRAETIGADVPAASVQATALTHSQKVHRLLAVAGAVLGLHLLYMLGKWWSWYRVAMISEQTVFRMRRQLFERLQRLQMLFHDQRETGRLMARVIDDVSVMQYRFSPTLMQTATAATSIVVGLSLAMWIQPVLGAIALLTVPAYAALMFRYLPLLKQQVREIRKENSSLYGLVRDRLAAPRVVKSFRQERREQLHVHRRASSMLRKTVRHNVSSSWLWALAGLIAAVGTATAMGLGIRMVMQGELTPGRLLFFHATVTMLFMPVVTLADIVGQVQWLTVVSERLCDILNEPITIQDEDEASLIEHPRGAIRFENVQLRYGESPRQALTDISMKIPAGAKVCIMGHSGAGKTSLASLVLRLYDPTGGRLRIDGVPLTQIKRTQLRKLVSYVPQEAIIFGGTLADNIAYGAVDATEDQTVAAAKAAEVHEFIDSLPARYNTFVGERGLTLSGGQKQRISLARALLHDPRILVLDDVTSALDAHTEARIQRTIQFALADRTALIITHRVSMSARADWTVVLDHGRIVEQGTHEDLLALKGHYWTLVRDQLSESDRVRLSFDASAPGS